MPENDQSRGIAFQTAMALRRLRAWFRNLRVAAKLWIGFGLVFGVVGALGLFVALSVNKLEGILHHATTVAEPLSAAAYEMEINAIGSGMGVMTYLRTPDAAFVARFKEDQEEFKVFQQRYDAVAPTEEARQLGQRAAQTHAEFQSLGASLIAAKDWEVEALAQFAEGVDALDAALEERKNELVKQSRRATERTATLLSRVREEVAVFSLWLMLQLDTANGTDGASSEQRRQRIADTRNRLGALTRLLPDPAASGRNSRLEESLDRIFATVDELLAVKLLIDKNVPAFAALRSRLDGILDEEVQIVAQRELLDTQQGASQKSRELRVWLLASSAAVLLLAAVSVMIIAKGILGPVRSLSEGTQALGSGQLDHRIRIASNDEIGQLANAFNRMAAQLETATGTLEAEVLRRTADLTEAKGALEGELERRLELEQQLLHGQKMESLGTLAGGIAHDFNNMLYVMLGSMELASGSLASGSPAHAQIARALEAGRRSKALVQKILSFSRQEAPKLEPVEFERLLRDSLDLLRASLPPAIDLKIDIEPACGTLLADSTQLEQVVVNLGVNAFQAMNKGSGSIHVAGRRVQVDTDMASQHIGLKAGEHVSITMRDNGSGIAPELLPKVMDPFFTTKPVGQGTGLGLSVAHGIVTSHGGTITLKSMLGEGTTVEIFLPLYEPDAESVSSAYT